MKKIINYIVIIVSMLIVCFGLFIDFQSHINMTGMSKIIIYVTPMLLLFVNMIVQIKKSKSDDEKELIKKKILWLIFIIYAISLATLLFLGSEYRYIEQNNSLEYRMTKINIIPFKTILDFLSGFINGNTSLKNVLVNIGGNLVAFSPMGYFIPALFGDKVKKLHHLILVMVVVVFFVELVQFVLNVGSADIDDIILNTMGAVIVYMFMKTKFIRNMIEKIL